MARISQDLLHFMNSYELASSSLLSKVGWVQARPLLLLSGPKVPTGRPSSSRGPRRSVDIVRPTVRHRGLACKGMRRADYEQSVEAARRWIAEHERYPQQQEWEHWALGRPTTRTIKGAGGGRS